MASFADDAKVVSFLNKFVLGDNLRMHDIADVYRDNVLNRSDASSIQDHAILAHLIAQYNAYYQTRSLFIHRRGGTKLPAPDANAEAMAFIEGIVFKREKDGFSGLFEVYRDIEEEYDDALDAIKKELPFDSTDYTDSLYTGLIETLVNMLLAESMSIVKTEIKANVDQSKFRSEGVKDLCNLSVIWLTEARQLEILYDIETEWEGYTHIRVDITYGPESDGYECHYYCTRLRADHDNLKYASPLLSAVADGEPLLTLRYYESPKKGGAAFRKAKDYITILGRKRKIVRMGRKKYVNIKGELVPLKVAKSMR
jgi:hypothetical protein